MEQTECSEMSAYKIQTPGNYREESIQHPPRNLDQFYILLEETLKSLYLLTLTFLCGDFSTNFLTEN